MMIPEHEEQQDNNDNNDDNNLYYFPMEEEAALLLGETESAHLSLSSSSFLPESVPQQQYAKNLPATSDNSSYPTNTAATLTRSACAAAVEMHASPPPVSCDNHELVRARSCLAELNAVLVGAGGDDDDDASSRSTAADDAPRTTTTAQHPLQPYQQQQQHRLLTAHDRTNSLPLPKRRSSLKHFPSNKSLVQQQKGNSNNNTTTKRSVSFSELQIREYNIDLSDHPACSYGPPIQLSWEYHSAKTVSVEDYETAKQTATRNKQQQQRKQQEKNSSRQQPQEQLLHQTTSSSGSSNSSPRLLPYNVRQYWLQHGAGYSVEDIQRCMQAVDRTKRERLLTDMFAPTHPFWDEKWEEVVTAIKQFFGKES